MGPAAARNRGWRASSGEYILFTDSDCIPDPDWAQTVTDALEAGADGVKGIYSGGGDRIIQRLAQIEFEERYALLRQASAVDMVDTYSAGFRREVLEEADGFDESFPVADHEDVELSYRLVSSGKRLVFAPAAMVSHLHRVSWAAYFMMKVSRGLWRMRVIREFPGKVLSDSYTPVCLRLQMVLSALLAPVLIIMPHRALSFACWAVLFLASCLPLMRIALKTDAALTPLVPFFALWRGLALTAGSLAGLLAGKR
jgi:GT2 family glycosyltransferase